MNKDQKLTLLIFIPVTLLIVALIYLLPGNNIVHYAEFASTVLLFLFAINKKTENKQKILIQIAFLFSVIGDFFLAAMKAINKEFDASLYGIALFLIAYLFLIAAFQKNFSLSKKEIIVAIPLLAVVAYFFYGMHMYLKGIMFPISILFAATITYMAWTAITSLFRGYFSKKVAIIIALAAVLIFFSDFAVAYEMFLPAFKNQPIWLEALVRATFIPAWMLFLVVLSEDNLKIEYR